MAHPGNRLSVKNNVDKDCLKLSITAQMFYRQRVKSSYWCMPKMAKAILGQNCDPKGGANKISGAITSWVEIVFFNTR